MNIERRLDEVNDASMRYWRSAAVEILQGNKEEDKCIEIESIGLANDVVDGVISVKALRQAVCWANAYDREAYGRLDGTSLNCVHQDDLIESVARRIAHHSGRKALKLVGTEFDKTTFIARK